jgi:DNA-binding MarR family transcriptional regulator
MRVAAFRAALRAFLHDSEQAARDNGLTPQRHLLLLMIKRAESAGLVERQQSEADARVVHLRLTPKGERCLAKVFTHLEVEREQLQRAFASLN